MPWAFAYAPRGPVAATWSADAIDGLHGGRPRRDLVVDAGRGSATSGSTSEIEADGPLDPDGDLRRALRERRLATGAADPAERDPDHRPARRRGRRCGATCARSGASTSTRRGRAASTVVDADGDRLGEFYRIYRETADRAGFLIRAEIGLPRRVGGAFARPATRGCLFAQAPDGEPQATLFLVRCGPRVVEPYGGMTAAGAESRANYLLKWEAIRSSREAGRHELRPVGPGDRRDRRTSRPGSVAARSATSGRGTSSSSPLGRQAYELRAARPRVVGAAARRARASGGSGVGLRGGRLNRPRRPVRTSSRTGTRGPSTRPAATSTSRGRGPSIGNAPAGGRASWSPTTADRILALSRRWLVDRRRQRVHPARPAGAGAADGRALGRAPGRGRRARSPVAGIGRRRGRPGGARRARRPSAPRSTRPGSSRSRRSSRRATGSRCRSSRGADEDGVFEDDRQVDPAADPRRRARRRSRSSRHDARWARRPGRGGLRCARPSRDRRRPSTGSTTCCSRPASGATSGSARADAFVAWWRGGPRRGSPRLPRGPCRAGERPGRSPASSCTATAGDSRPSTRATTRPPGGRIPGALHLLRWRAIQLAIREGCREMDLGGVDVAGRSQRAARGRSALRAVPAQARRSAAGGSS